MATRGFTPASGQDVFRIEPSEQFNSSTHRTLSGTEAKNFYETLIRDETGGHGSTGGQRLEGEGSKQQTARKRQAGGTRRRVRDMRRVRTADASEPRREAESHGGRTERPGNNTERSVELQGLRLLRCAHSGDMSGLKDLLSRGADVNFQDSFFWTAVMCASWSGQRAAVKLLLQHGAAWVGVVDTQGRDAKDLALQAGHTDVFEELESYGRSTQREEAPSSSDAVQPQWCSVCSSEYSSSLSSHLSSTLHQFSLCRAPPTPYYCLPPSSISYQMMVRSGWTPGTGLGPEGEGRRQPVSTVLKRDQEGLGFGRTKTAKVTHFQARDCDAVKPRSQKKEQSRGKNHSEQERRKEQRDKNWERDFRVSFYL